MNTRLVDRLPYVSVTISHQERSITLDRVVLDTGSVSTIFATDQLRPIGIRPELSDIIQEIQGIGGGSEFAVIKQVDRLAVGELQVDHFEIDLGGLTYHPDLDGILGLDFLLQTKAIIDLDQLEIRQAT